MEDFSDLHFASGEGDAATVEALLQQGHDPSPFDDISCTPLHYAAENGHLKVMKLLLDAGADVNAHDETRAGDTPLGRIAGNCSFEIAESLVLAGADPTIRGWMQLSALDRAKSRKRPEGRRVYELLSAAARKFPKW